MDDSQEKHIRAMFPKPPIEKMDKGELQWFSTSKAARKFTRSELRDLIARMSLFPDDKVLSTVLEALKHEHDCRKSSTRAVEVWTGIGIAAVGAIVGIAAIISGRNPPKNPAPVQVSPSESPKTPQ